MDFGKVELEKALHFLISAGCIERLGTRKVRYYVILGNGLKMLEMYPNWELRMSSLQLVSKGVIIPIGEHSDDRF